MLEINPVHLTAHLFLILILGWLSGMLCKRIGISLIIGYMLVGVVVGEGGLRLLTQENHELEYLARAGALLLLFSIGIEFSLEELVHLARYLLIGGPAQMLLVAIPVGAVLLLLGWSWQATFLIAFAVSLSSTVLVFKGLAEWGRLASPAGRRSIAILLFQDVALVPLMLVVPLLTGGDGATATDFLWLGLKSLFFVAAVGAAHWVVGRFLVSMLIRLKSTELLVLFSLMILVGLCLAAERLDLPPAIGALAAGLVLSGNRLSKQIDSLVLPYRESFTAVFFITLGALLRPQLFVQEPLLLAGGFLAVLILKSMAGLVALKLTGTSWKASLGAGIGLAQLGEFSFVLLSEGLHARVLNQADYERALFIALGTMILTPQLIKFGSRWTEEKSEPHREVVTESAPETSIRKALVVGVGPIGRRVASGLETVGVEVHLIDLSPINLYPFAQQGFITITGDARDGDVLRRAGVLDCGLLVAAVPDDAMASQIAEKARELNPTLNIIVRCRYLLSVAAARKAGANHVVSEEQLAAVEMFELSKSAFSKS